MTIIELLELIKKRPQMFFPETHLRDLYFFVSGFLYLKKVNSDLDTADILFIENFNNWILKKYNLENENTNWFYVLKSTNDDKEKGFLIAIELLSEWFEQNKVE